MEASKRRDDILKVITESEKPVTGSELSAQFMISRQIVVQDIALLRAMGNQIIATPRGYMIVGKKKAAYNRVFFCLHSQEELALELKLIVQFGGRILDVLVEHPVYGEFRAALMLEDEYQVNAFAERLKASAAMPLSALTGGAHFHTVEADEETALDAIEKALKETGLLIEE